MASGPRAIETRTSSDLASAPVDSIFRPLSPNATLAETFQAVVAFHAANLTRHRLGLALAPGVESVHDARRDIARLRAALRFFDGALIPADSAWIDGELSAWARGLGEARDLDILARRLARRGGREGAPRSQESLRHAIASAAREIVAARIMACAESVRIRFLVEGLWTLARDQRRFSSWADGTLAFAEEAPRRLHRLRARLPPPDARIDRLGARRRHDLRKRLKILRYSGDLSREVFGQPAAAEDARLLAVLDLLGDLNDAEVSDRLAKRLFSPLGLAAPRPFGDAKSVRRRVERLAEAWSDFASAAGLAAD